MFVAIKTFPNIANKSIFVHIFVININIYAAQKLLR